MTRLKRILVPLDFSEQSLRALAYAKTLAKPFAASLDLIHVVPNPYVTDPTGLYTGLPQSFLDELDQNARTQLSAVLTGDEHQAFSARRIVAVGDPLFEIVEYARREPVDLIVMGTHGRTGISHLVLGSVAERVVRTAPCPVLTVR